MLDPLNLEILKMSQIATDLPEQLYGQETKAQISQLDIASILTAFQAISETIQFDELLRQLVRMILQHSGGNRCALMLPDDREEWHVEAIATAEQIEHCSIPLKDCTNLPIALIQHVRETCEVFATDNSQTNLPVVDPYLLQQQPQSLLCLPLRHQGQLAGILYVSNDSTPGAFNGDRILILNFLCTQAAISLENARLYHSLEQGRELSDSHCLTGDLNECKLVEQKLHVSQQRYATLVETLPTGIFLTDLQGHSRYNNPSCCQMLGLTPAEALGEGWSQTLHPDDRDRVFQEWYRAAQDQQMPYQTDCRFLHRDGKVVWLSVQAVEECDPEGNLTGYIGSLTDITDRKTAEAALNKLVEGTAATTGEDFFSTLVSHVSTALEVPIALITQFIGEELQSIAFILDGKFQPNFTYNLPETPCIELVTEYSYYCPQGISDRFPNNPNRERGVESYLGIALRDRQGQVLGSLCIFDRQPLTDPERAKQILEICASRTAIEMERQRLETAMQNLISGTAVTEGTDFFPSLVRYLTEALGVSHALMAERVGDRETTLAYYGDGQPIPCQSLSLLGTPCEEVYQHGSYYCELEPCQTCSELAKIEAKSYLGVALYDRQGKAMGLLCIFHRQILVDPIHAEQILRVFAARASAELERQRAENALQNLIAGTAALTGPDFFPALVCHIAEALNASHAFVTEVVPGDRLHFLAAWADGEYLPNDTVDIAGTTCAIALREGKYHCDRDVVACFPQNPRLAVMGVESYMGVALQDSQGRQIGTLCIFSREPLLNPERSEQILRVFGARAAAELERQRAQAALEQLNQDLEQRVEERSRELMRSERNLRTIFNNVAALERLNQALEGRVEERTREIVRSERDLRTIFNNVYDGIFIHDLDGNIIDLNNRALELFGATRGQILAATIADLSALDSPLDRLPELMNQALAGQKLQFEWKHRRLNDNSTFDSEVSLRKVTLGNRQAFVVGVRDISDRKHNEEILHQQLTAIEASTEGIAITNARGEYTYLNRSHLQIFGYECMDELLGKTWRELYHRSEIEWFEQEVFPQLPRKRIWQGETLAKRKDGSQFVQELSLTLLPDNRIICVGRDISDRKQLEQEQARLIAVLEATPDFIGVASAKGEILWHNKCLRDIRADLASSNDHNLISDCHPEWVNQIIVDEALPTAIERGSWSGELALLDGKGDEIPVSQVIIAHKSELGEVECFSTIMRDIRDRKAAEEKLRASEQRYATLTAAAPVGIFRTNAVGSCVYVNERWCQIAGLTPEDASGEGWQQGLHPDDRDRIGAEWYESARDNRPFSLEYRFKSPDDRVTWVYGQSVAERDIEGNVTGYVGTVTDINERKETEKELQRINQELARATRLKDEFLANMSHELRTPLTAILGMAEGLQEGVFGGVDEENLMALETIEQSGLHLLALIDDILNLAKIESGQIELEYSSVAVNSMCESSLVFVKQQAGKKGIRLHRKIPTNLPEITIDERRIRQVLINLLNNAVKFTPEGGQIVLEVMPLPLDETRNQNTLRFTVTDTGIGIAPEDLKKLFQPFIQVDSDLNRQHDGTGLGLALVKRIVELHGGQVSVTSEVGVGSCFVFELPIQPLL
ncbi:PAS domain S-box protein [Roseofilum casamattae]|uniref:histidine kinase n=1 Tax=Roseofilum casamattae BLCC-M143 TaxID=3022442 RepID=A0ABT7C041_9CYAN|nr:PAS domain S-box protein [Roseofilum casamattae]MDJ1184812.1 PAS domain S-box protein [Roseofilum casamattae BLCC-M143]